MSCMRARFSKLHRHICNTRTFRSRSVPCAAYHTSPLWFSQPSESDSASPIDDYYSLLLSQPLSTSAQVTRTSPITSTPKVEEATPIQRARIVFGSRLAGPAERQRTKDSQSSLIAGVMVPLRPTEPDNCCMSGCVNCVWEAYRDDMEEWAQKKAEAKRRTMMSKGQDMGGSMDDDGGGSEGNGTEADCNGDDAELYAGVPVGIREFMRTEKRLKDMARMRAVQ